MTIRDFGPIIGDDPPPAPLFPKEGYAPPANAESWTRGVRTSPVFTGRFNPDRDIIPINTKTDVSLSQITSQKDFQYEFRHSGILGLYKYRYDDEGLNPTLWHGDNLTDVPKNIKRNNVMMLVSPTAMSDPAVRREMLDDDIENIQNVLNYPTRIRSSILHSNDVSVSSYSPAKYDYQIIPGDERYPKMVSLEDKLMQARAAFGLPVHGNPDIARAMKYYMYNRFKTPDINMAHSKTITHVFFTRPDCNLLEHVNAGTPLAGRANRQTEFHSEASMIWRQNPDLLKLLTDGYRCQDFDNFNLLLSNQVTSFDITDENLNTNQVGKTWGGYEMVYGHQYEGRTSGEFACNFTETNDFSIIHLMRLWITYIDNVARGVWLPSYNLHGRRKPGTRDWQINDSHVFTKTLDYAASAYVFKCGPDGETVLYWSKYYGIFPINTGASALQWDISSPIGDTPKLSIRFKYAYKRDMSPISLMEFNNASNVSVSRATYESSFNPEYGHSARPYVGTPFIELNLNDPQNFPTSGGVVQNRSSIKLRFRSLSSAKALKNDAIMYKARL